MTSNLGWAVTGRFGIPARTLGWLLATIAGRLLASPSYRQQALGGYWPLLATDNLCLAVTNAFKQPALYKVMGTGIFVLSVLAVSGNRDLGFCVATGTIPRIILTSRVIEALVELFASKDQSNRLLITATSGTAAARINGVTIHSACGFSKGLAAITNTAKDLDRVRLPQQAARFVNGQSRMDWQEKEVLVIDKVSMLGARTLHAVNEQLCRLRGSQQDFGGIPIVLFCGDFHQFRPVQERSILLPSAAVSWDVDNSFKAEQRHQHDRAHALWKKFTTVVMLDEQVRAAGDAELQRLLRRIRQGVQDHTDLDLLNSRCYREGKRIPWESGITVMTPLNRNRWNLNMEASLVFQMQQRSTMRIFISEHKWRDGLPTEEEATMALNQGDDSAIPVPAIFMFVPGMPVVVNHNTHQGLKLVNGASYTALEVVIDKSYPWHRVSADMAVHFGPPAGIMLESETRRCLHFVGMPPGTILLTPMTVKIECQLKKGRGNITT
ncbi:hypothetical protein HIM_12277 [Hirsutella minnesotensis 3608]|uniref:ATP-dependent DNA helicase n=1 Tax=Hirsutella minnesotensis 3608 TaxID=1043627 RepID=A0A0F7ZF12_9HYPO|nr:hypothetical protein HIM_12277 [Hirsutella minnesotensis 3608]